MALLYVLDFNFRNGILAIYKELLQIRQDINFLNDFRKSFLNDLLRFDRSVYTLHREYSTITSMNFKLHE